MTQTLSRYDRYISDFHALETAADGAGWVQPIRQHALDRFAQLGMPTARRGNEKWKYTNVGPIANATFGYPTGAGPIAVDQADVRQVAPWHDEWLSLVFVDGRHSPTLSTAKAGTNGVRVSSLAEAMVSDRPVVEQHLARYASVEDDGFTALNTAFLHDGAFVSIPEGEYLESPVHILFISTGRAEPTVSYPRVLAVAGPGSKATVIESYVSLDRDSRHFTNSVAEIVLGEGAEVEHYRLLLESDNAFHVGVERVHLGESSTFRSSAFTKSAGLGRYDLNALLAGPGSSCYLDGLYMTSGSQHIDNFINIDHAEPYTTSRLLYKGILDGKSRAVFGGTIYVREGAIKTDALQYDKNLVLSPDAEVDSKPALFIYADDVKCGHGATAGNIDQDTVFYMRSRGLDLDAASRLLIYGFASEVIDRVQEDSFRAYLEKLFLQSLPSYRFEF